MSSTQRINFIDLPADKNGGVWGRHDQLGTLNYLTDDVVRRAAQEEIQTGKRISLNWSMMGPSNPRFPRKYIDVNLINKAPTRIAHDDEWSFNSQVSSQWDGPRYYGYQQEKLYFMGHTAEDFLKSNINGIQNMAHKGIAGRGIFIDWYRWTTTQSDTEIDATSAYGITFDSLMEAAKSQGLTRPDFREGDILFVRSSYIPHYETMSSNKRDILNDRCKSEKPENIGLSPSRGMLEFLWDTKSAAVAGDSRSFEVWPCTELQWHLHEWLLAGWGMPIGELFDLEQLSRTCEELGRYTFFLSSEPLNVPGGVASSPNALAFF